MGKVVLLTGISGFLGSHLGDMLIREGFSVVGVKRSNSDTWRCSAYTSAVTWLNADVTGWKEKAIELRPSIIIHAAWEGVTAVARNDLKLQLKNLELLSDLLWLAAEVKARQFIGLGSQAEYGQLTSIADEDQPLFANTPYGMAKTAAGKLVEQFCNGRGIDWYWLRIFSVFGEKESGDWLIPSVIAKLLSNEPELQFTKGDQQYAYLYIEDLKQAIASLLKKSPAPGVYNISGQSSMSLKSLIEKIKEYAGNTGSLLNFGALPSRPHQSMHIEGSMKKFIEQVGPVPQTDMSVSLQKTIGYYVDKENVSKQ